MSKGSKISSHQEPLKLKLDSLNWGLLLKLEKENWIGWRLSKQKELVKWLYLLKRHLLILKSWLTQSTLQTSITQLLNLELKTIILKVNSKPFPRSSKSLSKRQGQKRHLRQMSKHLVFHLLHPHQLFDHIPWLWPRSGSLEKRRKNFNIIEERLT